MQHKEKTGSTFGQGKQNSIFENSHKTEHMADAEMRDQPFVFLV